VEGKKKKKKKKEALAGPSHKVMFDVSSFYRVIACNDCIHFFGRVFGSSRFF
jgi:hypothetical protein